MVTEVNWYFCIPWLAWDFIQFIVFSLIQSNLFTVFLHHNTLRNILGKKDASSSLILNVLQHLTWRSRMLIGFWRQGDTKTKKVKKSFNQNISSSNFNNNIIGLYGLYFITEWNSILATNNLQTWQPCSETPGKCHFVPI